MKDYSRVIADLRARPWAILPSKLDEIRALIELRATTAIDPGALEKYRAEFEARAAQAAATNARAKANGVAVIGCYGTINYRMNLMSYYSGGTSIQQLAAAIRQARSDSSIGTIVIDADSPGGGVGGVAELADELLKARDEKKIIGVSNTLAASACYWLLSSCSEIVVTPSGEVGSIGVFMLHWDESEADKMQGFKPTLISAGKYKTEGNPFEPLSDEARAALQADVDRYYDMFCAAVAKGRGVKVSEVKNGMGQGRCVGAKDAVALGMADRVASFDQVIAKLGVELPTPGMRSEELPPLPAATLDQISDGEDNDDAEDAAQTPPGDLAEQSAALDFELTLLRHT